MQTQVCTDCKKELPIDAFYKRNKTSEERVKICKPCYTARYYPKQVARQEARATGREITKDELVEIDAAAKARAEQAAIARAAAAAARRATLSKAEEYAFIGAYSAPLISEVEQNILAKVTNGSARLAEQRRQKYEQNYRVRIEIEGADKPIVVRVASKEGPDAAILKVLKVAKVAELLQGKEVQKATAEPVFFSEHTQTWKGLQR